MNDNNSDGIQQCPECGYYDEGRRGPWRGEWNYCPQCGCNVESDDYNNTDETDEDEYSDPLETGLRSGKGTGFFRRLLFGE